MWNIIVIFCHLLYARRATNDVGTENWDTFHKLYTRASRSNVHGNKIPSLYFALEFLSFYFQLILFISLLNFAPKKVCCSAIPRSNETCILLFRFFFSSISASFFHLPCISNGIYYIQCSLYSYIE